MADVAPDGGVVAGAPAPRRLPWLVVALAVPTLLALAWLAALAGAVWFDLAPAEADALRALLAPRLAFVVLFVLLVPVAIGIFWAPWLARWPRAARRLREEVAIVTAANAGHRITGTGAHEMRELARAIDELARAHAALRDDVDRRIAHAGARLAEETRRLAALMSQLPQAVLVCNREGRILLYNARASQLLGPGASAGETTTPAEVGLGRAVTALLDGAAIDHAWQQIVRRLEHGDGNAAAHFVTRVRTPPSPSAAGALLRVHMVPVSAESGEPHGYVLICDDITRAVEEQTRRDELLQRLTEGTRSALGTLRAAAQAMQQYAMDDQRRTRFMAVVYEEAERLAAQVDAALHAPPPTATAWPLEDVQLGDLVVALQRRARAVAPGVEVAFDGVGAACWLQLDSHAIVQMLAGLVARLAAELGVRAVAVQVLEQRPFVRLDLGWHGAPLDAARLLAWEAGPDAPGSEATAPRVREILDRHGAEIWSLAQGDAGAPPPAASAPRRLCVQFVGADGAATASPAAHGRPIYYDFDLLQRAPHDTALDQTPLTALSYTVFDTETTGLRPSDGDEIIAIGAVRIVNGRLLENERFDRRVRPRRAVRASAEKIHGISNAMLESEPPLEQVLPHFARFCEDTVLVAHNAAFDMRFLELARERCGVRFDHPVLDTLLLASIVQPGHGDHEHHLELVAERLGVAVVGRHQALGDALVTGRVFLKLVPLLAERGIRTFGEARAASLQSALARERY